MSRSLPPFDLFSAVDQAPGSFVEFGEDDRAANSLVSPPSSATMNAQLQGDLPRQTQSIVLRGVARHTATKDRSRVTLSPVPAPSDS
jgi:hypothetical protein